MKKRIYQLRHENRQAYLFALFFLFVLVTIISVICFTYYGWLQTTIKAESNSYLRELSKKTGSNVESTVNSYFGLLDTMESVLHNVELDSPEKLQPVIERQKDSWNFRDLLLIDEEGEIFDANGGKFSLPQADYLQETIVNRKRVISPAQLINGAECILFTIPTDQITVGQTPIRALGITYLLDSFDDMLSTASFDGKAYTNIINADGSIAIPSSSSSAVSFGYNLIYYLEKEAPKQAAELDTMKKDIKEGISGQFECTFGGVSNYVTYYPIDILDWCLVTMVPVDVANAKTQGLLVITLWFCGFIVLLVTALVFMLAAGFFRNKRNLEKLAFVDTITGGNTLQRFTILTNNLMKKDISANYALIYTNLEKFRLYNEQFGREVGNFVLKTVYRVVSADLSEKECICRIVDDHFCILVEYHNLKEVTDRFEHWYEKVSDEIIKHGFENPVPQYGAYLITNTDVPLESIIDRARFTLNKIDKIQTNRLQYAIYDENAHLKAVRERYLETRMEEALKNHEFVVYLQPKYKLEPEKVGGAEALIRWKTSEGMIFPDEFIPLFEKNGFIMQIDLFVFEEVCKTIKGWIDAGLEPVPVSINCSRRHFMKEDFMKDYQEIYSRYEIPPQYLELELTESIVYEDMQRIVQMINQIHEFGFRCSIDDFGSGYSSLNMLKDVPADVLKIDKIFFHTNSDNDERGKSVVENIISMAKSLSMTTVAEGVEYRSQVEMLHEMHCDYIQGYVFAKPMPIADFELLAFEKSLDPDRKL